MFVLSAKVKTTAVVATCKAARDLVSLYQQSFTLIVSTIHPWLCVKYLTEPKLTSSSYWDCLRRLKLARLGSELMLLRGLITLGARVSARALGHHSGSGLQCSSTCLVIWEALCYKQRQRGGCFITLLHPHLHLPRWVLSMTILDWEMICIPV